MNISSQPLVVIACEVMRGLIDPRLPNDTPITFMSYDYHVRPKSMKEALQSQLDKLTEPSRVIIGYGSCGNGMIGLNAGPHTLFIPRMDDCIAMMLGSYDAYIEEFRNNPGTYFLNKGWLESGNEPMSEYLGYVERYGEKKANILMEAMYAHYTRLCFIAFSEQDLIDYRPKAKKVADFCVQRWDMSYIEKVGTEDFISGLIELPDNPQQPATEYLIIEPGETVEAALFRRNHEQTLNFSHSARQIKE